MDLVQAIVFGVLQGVFEWLPVSSEAVITLALTFFSDSSVIDSVNTAIWLHTGTMLAALVYFRHDFLELLRAAPSYIESMLKQPSKLREQGLMNFLAVSTAVTGVSGGLLYLYGLKAVNFSPEIASGLIGVALVVTGILKLKSDGMSRMVKEAKLNDSLVAGFLQGLAVIPGISRSGSTVFGLLFQGFSSEDAFKLSFLMSVPAVLIANIGINIFSGFTVTSMHLVSAFVAMIVGYISIDLVLGLAERTEVAYICFLLAVLSWIPVFI